MAPQVGWYSPFLMAAWDPETECFQSVCRCMSGFSDAFYEAGVCCSSSSSASNSNITNNDASNRPPIVTG